MTPKTSVVLFGPHGSARSRHAGELAKREGICEVDASAFWGESKKISSEDAIKRIREQLEQERCQAGFALHHFPNNLPEQERFEKMIKDRFGASHPFNQFKAVFLDVGRDPVGERLFKKQPILERDNPEYDPYDPVNKDIIGRALTIGTGNWIYDKPPLLSHFMKTQREMLTVDALKPHQETTQDIIRIIREADDRKL